MTSAHPAWPQLCVPAASAEPGPPFHTFGFCVCPALLSRQLPWSPDTPIEPSTPSSQTCHLASYSCGILLPACLSAWPPLAEGSFQFLFMYVPQQVRTTLLTIQQPSKSNSEAGWLGEQSCRLQPLVWCHLPPAHASQLAFWLCVLQGVVGVHSGCNLLFQHGAGV